MHSRLPLILISLLVWAICPGQANAHLVNSGFGPFYDGIAHLFVTPEDLLAVVALAFLGGLDGKPCGRTVLFVLPAAWLAGAVVGWMIKLSIGAPIVSALLLILLGLLVVAAQRHSLAFVAGVALTCGVLKGFYNGALVTGAWSSGLMAMGVICAVFVITALIAGQVSTLNKEWSRIMVRVAGSWIGAIGLLMLGWAFR